MNISINSNQDKLKGNPVGAWLGYGAEFITIFLAFLVLSGRIYAQSYWKVFGLFPELTEHNILDYAVVSPNVAVISVFITATTMLIIAFFRRNLPDLIGEKDPRASYFIGFLIMWIGITVIAIIPKSNLSTWTPGLSGLVFGLGFLSFLGGMLLWFQGGLKLESKLKNKESSKWKWQVAFFNWIQNIPQVIVVAIIIIGFSVTAIWALADTAQKFGANEAKFMLITKPEATLVLDSLKGFEDIATVSNTGDTYINNVVIVAETNEFTYFCYGFVKEPFQLLVRAIPSSRVQAISYSVGITHLGE